MEKLFPLINYFHYLQIKINKNPVNIFYTRKNILSYIFSHLQRCTRQIQSMSSLFTYLRLRGTWEDTVENIQGPKSSFTEAGVGRRGRGAS